MREISLGRFGDRRLEKGGSFCTHGLSRPAARACGFVGLAQTVPETIRSNAALALPPAIDEAAVLRELRGFAV